jgi:hypothetical protein
MSNPITVETENQTLVCPGPVGEEFEEKACEYLTIECDQFCHDDLPEDLIPKIKGLEPSILEIRISTFVPDKTMKIVSALDLSECVSVVLPTYPDIVKKEQVFWPSLINLVIAKAEKLTSIEGYFEFTQALGLAAIGYKVSGEVYINEYGRDHVKCLLESLPHLEPKSVSLVLDQVSQSDYEALKNTKTNLKMEWDERKNSWGLVVYN